MRSSVWIQQPNVPFACSCVGTHSSLPARTCFNPREVFSQQYQVHQCTKAYNDTIRVYESKLPVLGIDAEEIGFEPIPTATSLMPARMVTRA